MSAAIHWSSSGDRSPRFRLTAPEPLVLPPAVSLFRRKGVSAMTENVSAPFDWCHSGLSSRTYNALLNNGYHTIEKVRQADDRQLLRMPNFGRRSLDELRAWLDGESPKGPLSQFSDEELVAEVRSRSMAARQRWNLMKYVIEKGVIPRPGEQRVGELVSPYPFSDMEVGDSFFVPGITYKKANSVCQHRNRGGRRYGYRTVEGGCRIWRFS
jgi:hypothetical protein